MAVDDAYTIALLHMDGSDASTTFTDESGKTWTAVGNAQIDTAQSKFGGASGLFDGTGDYVDTPDHADFDVGSGDFTIDFWTRRSADGAVDRICGQGTSAGSAAAGATQIRYNADDTVTASLYSSGTQYAATSTGTITADSTWHHIAFVRDGNTLRLFIDGSADGTDDVTGVTANDAAAKFTIGRWGEYAGNYYTGWIDEFRFSKGIARWTSNFTPPTSAYSPVTPGDFFAFF